MDIGMITLSFDDGRKDNFAVAKELLEKYQIPATFNIATGYIEGKVDAGRNPALSKEELIEMYGNPLFEIAAHGDMHKNDLEDISNGRKKLIQWLNLPDDYKVGFASPGSEMSVEYIEANAEMLKGIGFQYVRTGLRVKSKKFLRTYARKAARLVHSPQLFKLAYADTLQESLTGLSIVSIPILHDTTLKQVQGIVDLAAKKKRWCVLMFHSIEKTGSKFYDDTWTWDSNAFEEFLKYLDRQRKEEKLDIITTETGYRYV